MIPLRWVSINRRAYPPLRPRMLFPLERATIIAMLDDDTLYVPSAVAEVGYAKGSPEYLRARRAFSYFGLLHGMRDSFDNVEKDPGDAAAWYGSSWKWALGPHMHRVADVMDRLAELMVAYPGTHYFLDGEILRISAELQNLAPLDEPAPLPEEASEPELIESSSVDPPQPETPPRASWRRRGIGLILMAATLLGAIALYLYLSSPGPTGEVGSEPGRSLGQTIEYFGDGD